MLSQLTANMKASTPLDKKHGKHPRNAAVLLALTSNESNPSVILTKRADHLNSHSGEVSLPGGKWELQDDSLMRTALRETHEEIGMEPHWVDVISTLPVAHTWQGIEVTPYVGIVAENLPLTPNPNELDAIFEVPLSFFLEDRRTRTDVFPREEGDVWSPAYDFDGYEIWGFTARLMVEFLNQFWGSSLSRANPAREKDWSKDPIYIERRRQALAEAARKQQQ
jgi:8-oxo-dGTP pyrophosphatase MutT (NUDIX family)